MAPKGLKCPLCGTAISAPPFKAWTFGKYGVGRYECKKCKAKFNLYQGPKGTYTIPKGK